MALRKLQYFFTKVMGPYHFFDGSGTNFLSCVNELLVYSWLIEAQGILA